MKGRRDDVKRAVISVFVTNRRVGKLLEYSIFGTIDSLTVCALGQILVC
jgi:hypothetical protein